MTNAVEKKLSGGKWPWGSGSWMMGCSFKQNGMESLNKQVTSGQISEGGEKVSHMTIREKSGPAEGIVVHRACCPLRGGGNRTRR